MTTLQKITACMYMICGTLLFAVFAGGIAFRLLVGAFGLWLIFQGLKRWGWFSPVMYQQWTNRFDGWR